MTGFPQVLAWLARAAFMLVLVGLVFSARVIVEGESELRESDAAFDRGELEAALRHARRSATLYAPGAPHVGRAYERLFALARGAEAAADPKLAFAAWQAVRSAALESRHVFVSRESELTVANGNLARLEALTREEDDATRRRTMNRALGRLSADEAPDPLWIAVLGFAFLLSLAGLALFAGRGVTRTGKLESRPAWFGLLLFGLGAACWTLAAYRA